MDPQSQAFTPYSTNSDTWRLQTDVVRLQQVQAEHSERLARLERRQDDDARMKSVWGSGSPFPSVLSGTPQQAPLNQPPSDAFRGFDDDASNHLMSSLHLDATTADDEPRRSMGANSRANSVRFDESANQNHFSHSTRPSVDFLSRTSSGLGGLQMTERTASHKSDGRASSAHSMRSAASGGRASSLNLDTGYSVGGESSGRSPLETPGLAPGLLLLGSVPAIIRCWMNTNFKHDALLYAAVCTGSYKSYLDLRLITKLGFEGEIRNEEDGLRMVELPVYFPEAVPHPASSRSSSPAPQLPTLTVDFQVVEQSSDPSESKAIQIFLGSDVLRSHSADILFSSNSMTLFDDDRSKLSIPLVRPENEAAFKGLYITSGALPAPTSSSEKIEEQRGEQPYLNGLGRGSSGASLSSAAASPPPTAKPQSDTATSDPAKAGATSLTDNAESTQPSSSPPATARPSLTPLNTRPPDLASDTATTASQPTPPLRSGSSPAIWSNWRREGSTPSTSATVSASGGGLDWASASKNRDASSTAASYQRKEAGIKVLKPKIVGAPVAARTVSNSSSAGVNSAAASTATGSTNSPGEGKSRFFEEGRRRSGGTSGIGTKILVDKKENAASSLAGGNGNGAAPPKTKANPIGGGSAFSWLNSGGGMGSGK